MTGTNSRVAIVGVLTLAASLGAAVAAPQAGTVPVAFFGLESRVPDTWVNEAPASSMRLLQMTVPGTEPGVEAEMVVFFFGRGQGGDAEANIERWRGQFSSEDGGPVEPRIDTFAAGELPVTIVELTGTYRRGMGGGTGEAISDQTLVAAIVETDRGSLFAQLHGPAPTVASQRDAFDAFLRGLRPEGV